MRFGTQASMTLLLQLLHEAWFVLRSQTLLWNRLPVQPVRLHGHLPTFFIMISWVISTTSLHTYVDDSTATPRDYESLHPYFLGIPSAAVKKTYDATTQYYSNFSTREGHVHMYKSPFPAANIFWCGEDVSTDTLHSDTTAWGGATCMQLFAGSCELPSWSSPESTQYSFLADNILRWGFFCNLAIRRNYKNYEKITRMWINYKKLWKNYIRNFLVIY